MPRAKFPPTPTTSTEPVAQDKFSADMESTFILPPAAMNRSPLTSPVIQRKRTLSGSAKAKEELPPPPSRARKIIQMKPKDESAVSCTPTSPAKNASPKSRKQPSATSAAGRKIARKTAHSVIERRRRSKMNEEFGVLKDMIPACKSVEMHKLAILQAGIEYVKYLQVCVDKLQNDRRSSRRRNNEDEDMEEVATTSKTPSASPRSDTREYRRGSTATASTAVASAHPSPALMSNVLGSSLISQRQLPPIISETSSTSPQSLLAQTPTPTGVSPAFGAFQFSPDLSRTYSSQHHPGNQSPNILPLPKAALSMGGAAVLEQHGDEEATATAALMMLTNDRRASGGMKRGGGMSVRDLLSH